MTVFLVTQHYPPDPSTTANILHEIASELAQKHPFVVLSGTPGFPSQVASPGRLRVIEIPNRIAEKGALLRRGFMELRFGFRAFMSTLRHVRRGAPVLIATAPFLLPYFAAMACRCRGARPILILHDLYPDVLIASGITRPQSLLARTIRIANGALFRALSAIVTIGRDMEPRLLNYRGVNSDKIVFIPNWANVPLGVRGIAADNPFRRSLSGRFVVGLSGNLGFTHDPVTVFEAARILVDERDIHFMLSGWGVGWERLKLLQEKARLGNVTLIDRVSEKMLEDFLAAADIWVIPYRKNLAGVSVPSKLYNLLAIGRPVIALSEPDAEHSVILTADDVGWVVPPEDPWALADTIRMASRNPKAVAAKRQRAVEAVARRYTRERAMQGYSELIDRLSARN